MLSRRAILFCIPCLVLCTMLFSGCRPKGVLGLREMREVIIDLHKTDAMLQVGGMQYGHKEAKSYYYGMALEKHGITQAQFDSSLVWYTAHPQLFDKIYPKVLSKLEEEEAAFNELYAAELGPMRPKSEQITISLQAAEQYTDSVLWVTQYGYPSSWHVRPQSSQPFRMVP